MYLSCLGQLLTYPPPILLMSDLSTLRLRSVYAAGAALPSAALASSLTLTLQPPPPSTLLWALFV